MSRNQAKHILFVANLTLCLLFLASLTGNGNAAAGDLDLTFNGKGFTTTNISAKDEAFAVAIQPDGKIVAAGYSTGIGTAKDFTLVRYNSNGTPDINFGTGGKVITQAATGNLNDVINGMALQSDGNIVVAGAADISGGKSDFVVARYISTTGTLDPGFGVGGIVLTSLSTKNDTASAVAIQIDKKILVGGSSDGNFALVRYNPNGTLDTSFNGVGSVTTDFGGNDLAGAMLLQPDGNIVLGGSTNFGATGNNFALARYTTTGALDTTFNSTGKVITNFLAHSNEFIEALALTSDDKIVAAGRVNSNVSDFAIARYTKTGSLDATFGGGAGFLSSSIGSGADEARAVTVIHPSEDILVAGFSDQGATRLNDIALARYKNDGSLNPAFGSSGIVTTTLTATSNDQIYAMALQPDHNIVVAGSSDSGTDLDFAVARYQMPNAPPLLTNISSSGFEDNPILFSPADFNTHFNDADNDPLAKIKVTSLPANGVLKLNNAAVTLNQEILAADLGNLAFHPDLNWNGSTSFNWNGFDGIVFSPIDAAVDITIQPVNDAPSFSKGPDIIVNPPPALHTFTGWATAINPGPSDEASQSVNFIVSNNNNALFEIQPSIDPTGTLTFKTASSQFGIATITVSLKDNGGTANGGVDTSAPQTFSIMQPYQVFLPSIQR
jgi:uncharacterized delta-60 repeat protein